MEGDRIVVIACPEKRTWSVETTLSLAIKPEIRAVTIRQSLRPMGLNIGAIDPERRARMLLCEFATRFRWGSKLCRNHITIEAIRITEKARDKKSLALSHSNNNTFLAPGRR